MENKFFKRNKKIIIIWAILLLAGVLSWALGLNKKILAILIVTYGLITQIFSSILGAIGVWIGTIPSVGPLIIKIIMWPFFILINAIAYLITLLRIKKNKPSTQLTAQAMVMVLSIGILIGYLLSKIF